MLCCCCNSDDDDGAAPGGKAGLLLCLSSVDELLLLLVAIAMFLKARPCERVQLSSYFMLPRCSNSSILPSTSALDCPDVRCTTVWKYCSTLLKVDPFCALEAFCLAVSPALALPLPVLALRWRSDSAQRQRQVATSGERRVPIVNLSQPVKKCDSK